MQKRLKGENGGGEVAILYKTKLNGQLGFDKLQTILQKLWPQRKHFPILTHMPTQRDTAGAPQGPK